MVGDNTNASQMPASAHRANGSVCVVIPTLDESGTIAEAIGSCRCEGADEIVVVDGGSTDGTLEVVERCHVDENAVLSNAQRARQMNHGATLAKAEWLVFLHADSIFEAGGLAALRRTVAGGGVVGGGFRRRYQSPSHLLAASCNVGNLRARHLGWCLGDQAIWVSRGTFLAMGGFPEIARFEDFDFSRQLARRGATALISPGIMTSARRFEDGVAWRIAKDAWLTIGHLCRHPKPQR